ncbi:MAG: N-acetyltransferase [Proteobacteria bacterium]|nr:N-acetyltransferase [Pseudomonadota bacterium]
MIRAAVSADYPAVVRLWLAASLQAHSFVPAEYWTKMQKSIARDYLPNSRTFVFIDKRQIKGFISIVDDSHVGALFVDPRFQGRKIGSKLLKYVRRRRSHLSLNVFARNRLAICFYQQNDFKIVREQIDHSTKEKELTMAWAMGCKSGHHKRFQEDS